MRRALRGLALSPGKPPIMSGVFLPSMDDYNHPQKGITFQDVHTQGNQHRLAGTAEDKVANAAAKCVVVCQAMVVRETSPKLKACTDI